VASAATVATQPWTVQPLPLPVPAGQPTLLTSVSCGTATSCVALGHLWNNQSEPYKLFAEIWNGTNWKVQFVALPAGDSIGQLDGVSCASSTACTAVGWSSANNTGLGLNVGLAERWNGSSWVVQPVPSPAGSHGFVLRAVSCPTVTTCTAVGYDDRFLTVAERWNGSTWTVQPTPNQTPGNNVLLSVSCTSTTACMSVGQSLGGPAEPVFGESWNGTGWTLKQVPLPKDMVNVPVDGVGGASCLSNASCVAVGLYYPQYGSKPFADGWDGSAWHSQLIPSIRSSAGMPEGEFLSALSCGTSTCTAVGTYHLHGNSLPIAEVWNGTAWHLELMANPGGITITPYIWVSCVGTACTAVGIGSNGLYAEHEVGLA
jgi:hypothetical protein